MSYTIDLLVKHRESIKEARLLKMHFISYYINNIIIIKRISIDLNFYMFGKGTLFLKKIVSLHHQKKTIVDFYQH